MASVRFGQPGLADDAHGIGDGGGHGLARTERGDGEGNEHAASLGGCDRPRAAPQVRREQLGQVDAVHPGEVGRPGCGTRSRPPGSTSPGAASRSAGSTPFSATATDTS